MTAFLTIMLVCLTLCFPALSWAREDAPLLETSIASTFALAPSIPTRLRDLSPETDSPRMKGLLAKITWLKGRFVTETEIANSYGGMDWLANRMPGDNRTDPSKQMVRLGIKGTAGALNYGFTYRNAGQAFLNLPDQGIREMWGEWKPGLVTFRSAMGQLWNNVAEDAARSRLMQTYGRMTMAIAKPSWPELSLTYGRNSFASMLEPLGVAPQRTQSHTLEGAVAYQSLRWNVRVSSSYSMISDLLRGGAESNVRMQLLTATFRPLNTLTISPMVGYREEIQDLSGVRIDGPSASLALHYKQSRRLLISATANYASSRSNDRQIDNENVSGKGILAWDVQPAANWSALIAVEAGYSRVSNRVTPSADTEDISGLVRFVLADL